MSARPAVLASLFLASVLARTGPSFAQTPPKERAADRLFEEGKKLWDDPQRWREGCERFAATHGLDPSASTAVKLARCEQRLAEPARAHHLYDEAIRRAEADPALGPERQRDLLALARTEQAALTGVGFLSCDDLPSGTVVLVDGQTIDRSASPRQVVNAGPHRVRLVANGREPHDALVTVGEGDDIRLVWPPLPEPVVPTPAPAEAPPPVRPRAIALPATLAAGGLLFTGAAGYFAYRTDRALRDAKPACDAGGACTPAGLALRDEARVDQTRALVAGGIGAAFLGAGAFFYWRSGRNAPSDPLGWGWQLGPGTARLERSF